MFYVIAKNYAGPNPDEHLGEDMVQIWNLPARKNLNYERCIHGYCGTSDDWSTYAFGEYATIEAARSAIVAEFGDVEERNIWDLSTAGDEKILEAYRLRD